ncbi:MAG: hypothetical protein E6J52_05955 [Chloroflexi bacterium]|nr:MAG: hypothetical protein E6J52_05955 [Chloroflexota bacterium]
MRDVVATTVRGRRITPQSPHQREFVDAIRKHALVFATGPAGTGKCVAGDSLVITNRGIVPMADLGVGLHADETDLIDVAVHGLDGAERATLVYSGGVSDTLRIVTRFGYSIEITPEHPLLVRTRNGETTWRQAAELSQGDVIALQRGQRFFGGRTLIDFAYHRHKNDRHSKPIWIGHLDEQIAYVLGILTGDGNLTVRNRIGLSCRETEVIAAFEGIAKRFGLHVMFKWPKPDRTGHPDRVIASSQLYQLLLYLGMQATTAPHKTTPQAVLRAPEEIVCAFLRGLYDTDGSIERNAAISLTLTSERLIHEVHILLLNLGIVASKGIKRGTYKGERHISHRLVIAGAEVNRFVERVGFGVTRKRPVATYLKRNANVDLIPFVGAQLIAAIGSTGRMTRAEHGLFRDYRHERRRPGYEKLGQLVGVLAAHEADLMLLAPLREVLRQQLLFVPIQSITPGRTAVYDLTVPGSHSFVANGFVNHNSFLSVAMGVNALRDRKVARLILTRPAVEAGERLGFLPGGLQEKIDPYLRPLHDALYEMMPPERFARAQERNEIEVAPLAYMRGRSLNEAFIILDEAQNTTAAQMKMFLTRLGFGSQAVVNGDITQIDLERGQQSGLILAREILRGVEGIAFVDFDEKDVIRHELVARIVRAYDRFEKQQ